MPDEYRIEFVSLLGSPFVSPSFEKHSKNIRNDEVRRKKQSIISIDIIEEERNRSQDRRRRAGGIRDTRNSDSTVVNPALNLEQSNVHCLPSSVSRRNTNSPPPPSCWYTRGCTRIHKRVHTPTHAHTRANIARLLDFSHERVSIARGYDHNGEFDCF